ncbi:MAG: uncharacterized protein A8A55_1464 [Amphiamblys sp. WSBS2006]|nr:MAG: uncharacterized protein A8A55_1464 [Amphiamblys sp. WSBS2006]
MQVLFSDFLKTALHPETKTENFVLLSGYEIDIRVSTFTKTKENPVYFIEVEMEYSDLEAALFQAVVYAYKQCAMPGDTNMEAVLAVSVPDYHARIGVLKSSLNAQSLEIEYFSLGMGNLFFGSKIEGTRKLIGFLLSTPRELTVTAPEDAELPSETNDTEHAQKEIVNSPLPLPRS